VVGVPLNHLVGRRFQGRRRHFEGGRLNFPCKYLERYWACRYSFRSTIAPA
jgi:hypothetical protein